MGVDLPARSGQTREVVLSTLLAVFVAFGDGPFEPRFEWVGDGVCPGAAADLEIALSRYLGPAMALGPARAFGATAVGEAAAPIETSLTFRDQGPAGLGLQLGIVSAFGQEQHELTAMDCERLIDQAALVIAGVVDPFVTLAPEAAPSSAALHHAARANVVVQRPTPKLAVVEPDPSPDAEPLVLEGEVEALGEFGPLVAVELDRRAPIVGALGVGATTFVGVFPQVGGGVELEGALERGPLRWQNAASGWFGGRFRASDAEIGADLWALGFATALCGVPAVGRVRVPLCAVGGVGAIRARAVGTLEPRNSTQPWVWVGAEVSLQVLARRDLGLALGAGVHGIVVRPGWEIRAPDVSYTLPPVMGLLRLTLEVRELRRKKSTSAAIETR